MNSARQFLFVTLVIGAVALFVGCGDVGHHDHDHHGHNHDHNEVITTVQLTFTPASGGEPLIASWSDPESDGSPVIENITLTNGETYAVTMAFLNELEDPAEDMTAEIQQESDEHQAFFFGPAVQGPANQDNSAAIVVHEYTDEDSAGFPVGLANTFTAKEAGNALMNVSLRHMPPVNGTAVKTGSLADTLSSGSLTDLPGSSDINVEFTITVE